MKTGSELVCFIVSFPERAAVELVNIYLFYNRQYLWISALMFLLFFCFPLLEPPVCVSRRQLTLCLVLLEVSDYSSPLSLHAPSMLGIAVESKNCKLISTVTTCLSRMSWQSADAIRWFSLQRKLWKKCFCIIGMNFLCKVNWDECLWMGAIWMNLIKLKWTLGPFNLAFFWQAKILWQAI